MRQPTIKDVAKTAGVSFKTVSRVLNGEAHVREELRDRVNDAVTQLGYRPSVAARGLSGAPSRLLAFMYDNPNFGYVTEAELGMLRGCRSSGYYAAIEPIRGGADAKGAVERIFSSLRVDGVILTPPLSDDEAVLAAVAAVGVPCVRIAPMEERAGFASIHLDEARGAYEVTQHLLAQGHRAIGFIGGPVEHGASLGRRTGFERALKEAGIRPDPKLVAPGAFTFESGLEAGRALLAGSRRPTAIFASNDQMALGVIAAAGEAGLDVPGQVSVAGFDDIREARMSWPPLTTARQPIAAMCEAAANMLIAAASGEPERLRSITMDTELIARGSVGTLG